jgi:GNAT superfamily N-acetyltransferase
MADGVGAKWSRMTIGATAIDCLDVPAGRIATVVTSLEMLERPAIREERGARDFALHRTFRPGTEWYRELFWRVGRDWLWFSRLLMTDQELRGILDDPLVEVYALRDGAGDIGLLELDFRVAEECELNFFGLVPGLVGTGAGRWLMNRTLEIAWSRPIRRFWVHTCTQDHPAALSFYIRSGFRPFQRYVEILDDPRLTGALPREAAPHLPVIAG